MEEEYILKYTGEETDALLKHTESLKDQTTAEDGENVQVYDKSGIPHKIAKTELLNKAILATTSIQDISKFIAINEAGNAVGIMTLEQITEVFRKEFAKFPSSSETSAVVAVNKKGDALGLMSNEKLAQVVGGLIGTKDFIKTSNNLLTSRDDMNSLESGIIYSFSPESGFPSNFPSSAQMGRGIIDTRICYPHLLQIIYAFNSSSLKIVARMSYDEGTHWYDWMVL